MRKSTGGNGYDEIPTHLSAHRAGMLKVPGLDRDDAERPIAAVVARNPAIWIKGEW